jgi:hypothetical protein
VEFICTQMGYCKIFQKRIYCAKITSHSTTVVSLNVTGREGTRNLFRILAEQLNFQYNLIIFNTTAFYISIGISSSRTDFISFLRSKSSKSKIISLHKWSSKFVFFHVCRLTCSGIDALPSFPRSSTISSSSRVVVKGVFRESVVVRSFKQ